MKKKPRLCFVAFKNKLNLYLYWKIKKHKSKSCVIVILKNIIIRARIYIYKIWIKFVIVSNFDDAYILYLSMKGIKQILKIFHSSAYNHVNTPLQKKSYLYLNYLAGYHFAKDECLQYIQIYWKWRGIQEQFKLVFVNS